MPEVIFIQTLGRSLRLFIRNDKGLYKSRKMVTDDAYFLDLYYTVVQRTRYFHTNMIYMEQVHRLGCGNHDHGSFRVFSIP